MIYVLLVLLHTQKRTSATLALGDHFFLVTKLTAAAAAVLTFQAVAAAKTRPLSVVAEQPSLHARRRFTALIFNVDHA